MIASNTLGVTDLMVDSDFLRAVDSMCQCKILSQHMLHVPYYILRNPGWSISE